MVTEGCAWRGVLRKQLADRKVFKSGESPVLAWDGAPCVWPLRRDLKRAEVLRVHSDDAYVWRM